MGTEVTPPTPATPTHHSVSTSTYVSLGELTNPLLIGPSAPSLPTADAAPEQTAADDEEHAYTHTHNQANIDVCLIVHSRDQLQRQRAQAATEGSREG